MTSTEGGGGAFGISSVIQPWSFPSFSASTKVCFNKDNLVHNKICNSLIGGSNHVCK